MLFCRWYYSKVIGMDSLKAVTSSFATLSQNPAHFLNGDVDSSSKFTVICAKLFQLAKSCNDHLMNDPFAELLLDGFDEEQIWQQVDIFNNSNTHGLRKFIYQFLKGHDVKLLCDHNLPVKPFEECDLSDNSILSETEESDVENDDDHNEHNVEEKTEVDDQFFSLREMERFLDKQEDLSGSVNNEIDYFNEIPSTDDEGGLDSPENSVHNSFGNNVNDEEKVSARQLQFQDFFPDAEHSVSVQKQEDTLPKSVYEKQQRKSKEVMQNLEEKALADPAWQMKGETTASKRPVNSLLEEVLVFDQTERVAPEITDEHTQDLESIICQRIKDKSWDDVERKLKDVQSVHEFKKKVVLDSDQSKLSLQQIYEKEYIDKMSGTTEDKEDPVHKEIKDLMNILFRKLDALSNYHFRAAPPEPEIKVLPNIPSIEMEEVQPVFHSDAQSLAPEEIRNKVEMKAATEKTSTDRKRYHRKKKTQQKVMPNLLSMVKKPGILEYMFMNVLVKVKCLL